MIPAACCAAELAGGLAIIALLGVPGSVAVPALTVIEAATLLPSSLYLFARDVDDVAEESENPHEDAAEIGDDDDTTDDDTSGNDSTDNDSTDDTEGQPIAGKETNRLFWIFAIALFLLGVGLLFGAFNGFLHPANCAANACPSIFSSAYEASWEGAFIGAIAIAGGVFVARRA